MSRQTILFIPVSQKLGSGEYFRCLSLARSLQSQDTSIDLHICANKAADVPVVDGIEVHRLDDSPTYCSEEVDQLIQQLKPSVVVFDNTLRREQLQSCKRHGARTVFISSRPKKRRTGFSPRKLRLLDEHWVIGSPDEHHLHSYEKLLLKSLNPAAQVRFFASMQPPADPQRRQRLLESHSFNHSEYVLFAPGGGSGYVEGYPTAELFQRAARQFEAETGKPTIFVAGPMSETALDSTENRLEIRAVSTEEFVDLIDGAKIFVTGAGSQLWQALVMHKPCVAIPTTGKEQPARLTAMVKHGVVIEANRTPESLNEYARGLALSHRKQKSLQEQITLAGYREGLQTASDSVVNLFET